MLNDTSTSNFSEKTLDAFLDNLLEELKYPQDSKLLEDVRRAFKKKVPLHLRSYASALMILRAAGFSRSKSAKKTTAEMVPSAPQNVEKSENLTKSTVSLFISMGKRHHLKPQELKKIISERAKLPFENLGRIHMLENYSFIEVPAKDSQRIVDAMVGAEIKGKPLEIKPAKKRSESISEGK